MVENYFIIDAHCHVYPDKIAAPAVASTGKFYGLDTACLGTTSDLIERGGNAGIDHYIIQSVATAPKQVESINRFIANSVLAGNGKFTGLGTLHPDSSNLKGDIALIKELGLHGVKLHPDIQEFKIDDYRCLKIYELCEQEGLPILMHCGDSRKDFSNPNRLLPVMQIFTELTVVGAHLGGWSVWEDALNNLQGLPNLYFDCCSCFPFMTPEKAREIIESYGTDRVLFGTDYPIWAPEKEVQSFFKMDFSREDNEKILSLNAKKIFID